MASVTFPVEFGGSGMTITDDADPTTGLDGTGYIDRFVPALQQGLAMTGHAVEKAAEANEAAGVATEAAEQTTADRDSINLDLQTLNGLVSDADASADAAAGSATTASNMADSVAQATATYTTVAAGLAATPSGAYFRVIEAPEAERVSVYRNDAGSATLITTYYTKTGVDAKQAVAVRLNRSLQRLGDNGQTLHSDFNLDAYGLGTRETGGVENALDFKGLFPDFTRSSPAYELRSDVRYYEVPIDTLARDWNPETGEYFAQISGSVTNEITDNKLISRNASDFSTKSLSGTLFNEESYKLTVGNATSPSRSYLFISGSGQTGTFTISCVVENVIDEGDFLGSLFAVFRLNETTITSNGGYDPARGFPQRLKFTFSVSGGLQSIRIGVGTTANAVGVFVFELPQLVRGTNAGPVIPTTDSPLTRASDNPVRKLGAEFDQNEGAFFIEFDQSWSSATPNGIAYVAIIGSSVDDQIAVYLSSGFYAIRYRSGGVTRASQNIAFSAGGRVKAAISWSKSLDQILVSVNGQAPASSTFFDLPHLSKLSLGRYLSAGFESYTPIYTVENKPMPFNATKIQARTAIEV